MIEQNFDEALPPDWVKANIRDVDNELVILRQVIPWQSRDFQRLVDLRSHGQSSQLPFSFSDPKTNFTPGGENCRKYRWSETGRWNTGSNLEDAHQGAETHLDHGRR